MIWARFQHSSECSWPPLTADYTLYHHQCALLLILKVLFGIIRSFVVLLRCMLWVKHGGYPLGVLHANYYLWRSDWPKLLGRLAARGCPTDQPRNHTLYRSITNPPHKSQPEVHVHFQVTTFATHRYRYPKCTRTSDRMLIVTRSWRDFSHLPTHVEIELLLISPLSITTHWLLKTSD